MGFFTSYLNPLDPLRDDVGVMHGDQRHLDSGHLAQFGGPHTCRQRSHEQSDDVKAKFIFIFFYFLSFPGWFSPS